jgi:hypothetical protein
MNARHKPAFFVASILLVLFVPRAHAQGRGMRGSSSGFRAGTSVRANRGGDLHRGGRRFENGFGFPFAPFFYSDYYEGSDADDSKFAPEAPDVQTRVAQAPPPAQPPPPGDTLILENHDGQWVRIPTGAEMLKAAARPTADAPATNSQVSHPDDASTEPARAPMPPAVLVFRDGHSEEVQKYVIHGANLVATAEYSATGSWTKNISLADLDIPASLKANKDRGTKFNLPSGPNEVVVRF